MRFRLGVKYDYWEVSYMVREGTGRTGLLVGEGGLSIDMGADKGRIGLCWGYGG